MREEERRKKRYLLLGAGLCTPYDMVSNRIVLYGGMVEWYDVKFKASGPNWTVITSGDMYATRFNK